MTFCTETEAKASNPDWYQRLRATQKQRTGERQGDPETFWLLRDVGSPHPSLFCLLERNPQRWEVPGPGEKGMSSVHLLPSCLLAGPGDPEETAFRILEWRDFTRSLLASLFSRLRHFAPHPILNDTRFPLQFPISSQTGFFSEPKIGSQQVRSRTDF